MSLQENKELARRYHQDIYKALRLDVADEILTPDFIVHWPMPGPGPEGVKQDAAGYAGIFEVEQLTEDDILAEGDKVMIRWTFRGKHHGAMGDIAPTGREVTFTGFDLFRIADGKLAELWTNFDELGMMQQIGAIPQP
jgi:predicted SnoaL-like aldol condensation-catalyzing enzyme